MSVLPGIALLHDSPAHDSDRLCVVVSDLHCTDGTVGNQSGEEPDWAEFFDQLERACQTQDGWLDTLYLVLNGDIVDLIRSAVWSRAGIYPWQRSDARFAPLLLEVLHGIIAQHASPSGLSGRHGFFVLLQQFRARLLRHGVKVWLIPIVGNHDKELLVVPEARALFYRACLGLDEAELTGTYQQWIDAMYGVATPPGETPWLPFYFADRGLRLFVTHGQWRDASNARSMRGWRVHQGWRPLAWQKLRYAPFTEPCFGDTVAAGLLSGFIWRCREQLRHAPSEARLRRILDEMDLYRPATAGLVRILEEGRRLARLGGHKNTVRTVCDTFRLSLQQWLSHGATWAAAPLRIHCFLPVLWLLARLRWEWVTLWIMRLMARVQEPEARIDLPTLLTLPAFRRDYRAFGFAIHSEGHTHVALEAELQFDEPDFPANWTYINTGAWRDRIIRKDNTGYRRRGIGRSLFVFDSAPAVHGQRREVRFFVRDVMSWGDHLDRL